ncbi:hypothetical protein Acor_00260 [Acrocarpospora corrugata]|uniref:Uncharacterized protein n=1 Tax=Acrocarpospora corrugata TaxID=35763 RepID=A0A5M3VMG7_9ACTN|nr:hypothetical protein Acor_00260 [Acrocarpospora corrugata]
MVPGGAAGKPRAEKLTSRNDGVSSSRRSEPIVVGMVPPRGRVPSHDAQVAGAGASPDVRETSPNVRYWADWANLSCSWACLNW